MRDDMHTSRPLRLCLSSNFSFSRLAVIWSSFFFLGWLSVCRCVYARQHDLFYLCTIPSFSAFFFFSFRRKKSSFLSLALALARQGKAGYVFHSLTLLHFILFPTFFFCFFFVRLMDAGCESRCGEAVWEGGR